MFFSGVNHAHIHRRGHGYGSERSRAELAALAQLGVDAIAVTPFGYQESATADDIRGFGQRPGRSDFFATTDPSMTDTDLLAEMSNARAQGMRVVVKPQIWSRDFRNGREWHGTIHQNSAADHARWWAAYRALSLHYSALAIKGGASLYCVGTELVGMSTRYPEEWRALFREIRTLPGGESLAITYSAHWDAELTEITFWDDLDYIGVGAYFPLDAPERARTDELIAAWAPHRERLSNLSRESGKPILFLEAGYRPVTGNHLRPWEYSGGLPDSDAQARAYEAMFQALSAEPWWRGVFFWKTFTDPDIADRHGDGLQFGFRGRPAENVVSRWFLSSDTDRRP
jgi:hypothetical protein